MHAGRVGRLDAGSEGGKTQPLGMGEKPIERKPLKRSELDA
jgi:hypothetical protein